MVLSVIDLSRTLRPALRPGVGLAFVLVSMLFAPVLSARPGDFPLEDVGLSAGFDDQRGVSVNSYEVSGTVRSAWSRQIGERGHMRLDFEIGFGILDAEGDYGLFVRASPVLEFGMAGSPVALFVTTGPLLLTEDQYGDFDLGGNVHFATAVGVKWRVTQDWSVGYRYQHISNAGIHDPNPGLDQHLIRVARRF